MINTIYTTTKVQCVTGVKSDNLILGASPHTGSNQIAAEAGSYTGNLEYTDPDWNIPVLRVMMRAC